MGIVITGCCDGCHRTGRLTVDGKYCSERCKTRRESPPPSTYLEGFGFGFGCVLTLLVCLVFWIGNEIRSKESPAQRRRGELERAVMLSSNVQTLDILIRAVAKDVSNNVTRLRTETLENP